MFCYVSEFCIHCSDGVVGSDCLRTVSHGIFDKVFPAYTRNVSDTILSSFHIYLLVMDALIKEDSSLNMNEHGSQLVIMSDRLVNVFDSMSTYGSQRLHIRESEIQVWYKSPLDMLIHYKLLFFKLCCQFLLDSHQVDLSGAFRSKELSLTS